MNNREMWDKGRGMKCSECEKHNGPCTIIGTGHNEKSVCRSCYQERFKDSTNFSYARIMNRGTNPGRPRLR